MSIAPPSNNFKGRIPELDGLRGLAILLVLIWHYFIGQIPSEQALSQYVNTWGRLTWSGVDLFLILSGFLIGGILMDARSSPNYFKAFYARRFYRILPLYSLVCLLLWLAVSLSVESHVAGWRSLFEHPLPWYTYATFTQNFWMVQYGSFGAGWLGVTWSLAVEEQFYLTLPLIIRYLKRARLPYVLAAIILIAPLIRALLYFKLPHGYLAAYILMPCRADSLMLGVVSALLVRSRAGWAFLVAQKRLLSLILTLLSLGMVMLTLKNWGVYSLAMTSIGYTWVALFYLCILLIALTQKASLLSRTLRNRALMWLGAIAYGTYLLHLGVLGLCHGLIRGREPQIASLPDAAVTLLALILTLALATLSWVYFEKPLVKRGHEHSYEESGNVAGVRVSSALAS
ncbi:MAG TPA: acyltransferase [Pyrinomonadaceae bacterium]|jgi:peptidoglycan/LPS O-acetylase OafA/YrhL